MKSYERMYCAYTANEFVMVSLAPKGFGMGRSVSSNNL